MLKGRGAQINPQNKFTGLWRERYPDFIDENTQTKYFFEKSKKILNKICSPDLPYGYSLNPYQGCEHGCIYCYARETHQYWDLSAGIDFESIIFCKVNAPQLLIQEINEEKYEPLLISLSGNTDPYQPIERKLKITRRIIEILYEHKHPFSIITKDGGILRDIDILEDAAREKLCIVLISLTTLNEELRRVMEPRASSIHLRLKVIEELAKHNIPVKVMIAPVIPHINDIEIPNIMERAKEAGAITASMSFVRLNGPIGIIFEQWVANHFPHKKEAILSRIKEIHGGSLEDRRFFLRHTGEGTYAEFIRKSFQAWKKNIFGEIEMPPLDFSKFRKRGWLF